MKRQNYFESYCQNKIPLDFYTHFRNFVSDLIRKRDYYENKFDAVKNDVNRLISGDVSAFSVASLTQKIAR